MFITSLSGYFGKLQRGTRTILQTCIYGVVGGLAVVAFQLLITVLYNATLVRMAGQPPWVFLAGSFCVMVGTALVAGFLLHSFCKEAAGSGIPQAKAAFWKDFGVIPWQRGLGEIFCRHTEHRRRQQPGARGSERSYGERIGFDPGGVDG